MARKKTISEEMLENDLDLCLVAAALADRRLEAITDAGIRAEHLLGAAQTAMKELMTHVTKYGAYPDAGLLARKSCIPNLPKPREPLAYYVDEISARVEAHVLSQSVEKAALELKRGDHAAARQAIAGGIGSSLAVTRSGGKDGFESWWRKFQDQAAQGGVKGIPTPWPSLTERTRGVRPGEFWLALGRMKSGKCVDGDTLLPDPVTGEWRTIRQIYDTRAESGRVLSFCRGVVQAAAPSDYWDTGVKPCVEIVTRAGFRLIAPPDDPLLTPEGWQPIERLTVGRQIAVAAYIPEPEQPVDLPRWTVELLAAMLADGGTTGTCATFTKDDSAIVERVGAAVGRVRCRLRQHRGCQPWEWQVRTIERLRWRQRSGIRRFMERFGLWGVRSAEKSIPAAVFRLPNRRLAQFLGMLWSCDGSVEANGTVSYCTASSRMAEQIRQLLLRFGVSVVLREKRARAGGRVFAAWELAVKGESKDRFAQAISLTGKKRERLLAVAARKRHPTFDFLTATPELLAKLAPYNPPVKLVQGGKIARAALRRFCVERGLVESFRDLLTEQVWYDQIRSMREVGPRHVYDLTVPESHNFVAGGVIAHNTFNHCVWAKAAWEAGHPFIFFSAEMAEAHIQDRLYAVMAGVDYSDIRNRENIKRTKQKMDVFKANLKKRPEFWIYGPDKCQDVGNIILAIRQHKVPFILIDSVYRIAKGGGRRPLWEEVTIACNALTQALAGMNVACVASSQYGREVDEATGAKQAGVSKIGYAYSMGQAADAVVLYHQDGDMKANRRMNVVLDEYRYGTDISLEVNWDVNQMDFRELRVLDGDAAAGPGAPSVDASIAAIKQSNTRPTGPAIPY